MTRVLSVEPLTKEAFSLYGDVITVEGAQRLEINDGTTERFHDLATVDVAEAGGRPLLSVFRAQPRRFPLAIAMMERHPLGSQAFVPLSPEPFLVVVASLGEGVVAEALRAFIAHSGQGVNYAKGVWHHPLIALNRVCDFLVVDRGGPGENCDLVEVSPGAVIEGR